MIPQNADAGDLGQRDLGLGMRLTSTETHRGIRRFGIALVGVLLSLGLLIPGTAASAAESTYPSNVEVVWTNLAGKPTKAVTATVVVTALGGYPVSGNVQICEDTRCYGERVALDPATGRASLSAIVPRDGSGVKALTVVYYGDGVVNIPGYGATSFKARANDSAQTEATIGRYGVLLLASRVNTAKPVAGKPVSVTIKVVSDQPKSMYQYLNGNYELLAGDDRPRIWGELRVQDGNKVISTTYLTKEQKGSMTFSFTPAKKGTYTLRIKYAGSEYFSPVVTPSFTIQVK